jgi:hypothetical protein
VGVRYAEWYKRILLDVYQNKGHVKGVLAPSGIYFQFVPRLRFLATVVVSERRLGNDGLLDIQRENWTLCAELQRSSC